jgi:amidase
MVAQTAAGGEGTRRKVTATHIMAMGLAGSLDDAFRRATSNMAAWMAEDYTAMPTWC